MLPAGAMGEYGSAILHRKGAKPLRIFKFFRAHLVPLILLRSPSTKKASLDLSGLQWPQSNEWMPTIRAYTFRG
jgi:hypothetical protein